MADLPGTWIVPVVRADFSDDVTWEHIKEKISEPTPEGYGADVEIVEDPALADLDEPAITAGYPRAYPDEYRHPVLFVVDAIALSRPEQPHPGPQSQCWGRCWPVPGDAPSGAGDPEQPVAGQHGLRRVRASQRRRWRVPRLYMTISPCRCRPACWPSSKCRAIDRPNILPTLRRRRPMG